MNVNIMMEMAAHIHRSTTTKLPSSVFRIREHKVERRLVRTRLICIHGVKPEDING